MYMNVPHQAWQFADSSTRFGESHASRIRSDYRSHRKAGCKPNPGRREPGLRQGAANGAACAAGFDPDRSDDFLSVNQVGENSKANEDWAGLGLAAQRSSCWDRREQKPRLMQLPERLAWRQCGL